jgi:hypothetical membrane protein
MMNRFKVGAGNDKVSRWLALCGVLTLPALTVFIVIAGLVTPGYNHLSETVSQLAAPGRPHPEIIAAGFVLYGVLINGFALYMYRCLGNHTGARVVWLLLGIHGIGIILSAVFTDDPKTPYTIVTLTGILHDAVSSISFLALMAVIWMLARITYQDPAWRGFARFSIGVGVLGLVLSLMFVIDIFNPVEGLLQRTFYFMSLIWIEVLSLRFLYRRDRFCNSQPL